MEKEIDLHNTTDGMEWAKEFCRLYNSKPNFTIDEGLMVAWFANAIEVGRQEGKKQGWKEGSRLEYAPNNIVAGCGGSHAYGTNITALPSINYEDIINNGVITSVFVTK